MNREIIVHKIFIVVWNYAFVSQILLGTKWTSPKPGTYSFFFMVKKEPK